MSPIKHVYLDIGFQNNALDDAQVIYGGLRALKKTGQAGRCLKARGIRRATAAE